MIDREIQSRMDAFRGNPQALAQRYAQNQELIDLLALQKLKSEKESAARDMQLKMGMGQLPTIADQREQEVMDMTKQEIAQQAAGVAQNKMRERQEAIKQLADNPQAAGIAAVPAPNIAPKMMAGGGIVAFEDGGDVTRESIQQLAERGIRTLLGQSPQDIYARRKAEAATEANYTPEERAQRERQIAERAAYDQQYFNPEAERNRAITRGLLSAAGGTTPGATLARMGVGIEGAREAAEIANRQRLLDRQKQAQELIDVGPAARMAGLKYGSEAEKYAMQGMHYGTDAAARLAQVGEAAASRAATAKSAEEARRIQQAEARFDANKRVILGQMDKLGIEPGSPESAPYYARINEMGKTIYERFQIPQYFQPDPLPSAPVAPPPKAGFGNTIKGILGLNPSTAPLGRVVDFSQIPRSAPQP